METYEFTKTKVLADRHRKSVRRWRRAGITSAYIAVLCLLTGGAYAVWGQTGAAVLVLLGVAVPFLYLALIRDDDPLYR